MGDTALLKEFMSLREQKDAAYKRLWSLGYLPEAGRAMGAVEVLHHLGDTKRRIVWGLWDDPQIVTSANTLKLEHYNEKGYWQRGTEISLRQFVEADELPEGFTGTPVLREAGAKLCRFGRNGFRLTSQVDGGGEQIFESQDGYVRTRVRAIPAGTDNAVLVFERYRYSPKQWEHHHRTTADRFQDISYRADVDLKSLPSVPPRPSEPDYVPTLRSVIHYHLTRHFS